MKLLSLLIAFLILAFSCIPCSDAGGRPVATQGEPSPSGHQDHKEDVCSPFCQCACCSVVFALPRLLPPGDDPKTPTPEKSFTCHRVQQPVSVSLPVWQPPQLV